MSNWHEVIDRVSKASIQRELDEAEEMRQQVDDTIPVLPNMDNEALLDLYENMLGRTFSNVRKGVQKARMCVAIRDEITKRLNK